MEDLSVGRRSSRKSCGSDKVRGVVDAATERERRRAEQRQKTRRMLRDRANLLRLELKQLKDKRNAADPDASDPQMQMLVTLRQRLRTTNSMLIELLALSQKQQPSACQSVSHSFKKCRRDGPAADGSSSRTDGDAQKAVAAAATAAVTEGVEGAEVKRVMVVGEVVRKEVGDVVVTAAMAVAKVAYW